MLKTRTHKVLKVTLVIHFSILTAISYSQTQLDFEKLPAIHPRKAAPTSSSTNKGKSLLFEFQTQVRDQTGKPTCSMYSVVGALESLMISHYGHHSKAVDLSEEWLLHVIEQEGKHLNTSNLGISSYDLIETALRIGMLSAQEFQKKLSFQNILLNQFKEKYLQTNGESILIEHQSQIKNKLDQGLPVILDFPIYYGAMNHPRAAEFGIDWSQEQLNLGVISYPALHSLDREYSRVKRPRDHSVLIVGYDDERIVQSKSRVRNLLSGKIEWQTNTYKGVYYIKNSWGTRFGKNFSIEGKKYPGFGLITQQYAHEFGFFFQWPVRTSQ